MHSQSNLSVAGATGKVNQSTVAITPIVPICRSLIDSGSFCRAPAVGGARYCRAHRLLGIRLRKMARARRRIPAVKLPQLLDTGAVELAAARVREAVRANRLDPKIGRLMLWALQMSHRIKQHCNSSRTARIGQFCRRGRM